MAQLEERALTLLQRKPLNSNLMNDLFVGLRCLQCLAMVQIGHLFCNIMQSKIFGYYATVTLYLMPLQLIAVSFTMYTTQWPIVLGFVVDSLVATIIPEISETLAIVWVTSSREQAPGPNFLFVSAPMSFTAKNKSLYFSSQDPLAICRVVTLCFCSLKCHTDLKFHLAHWGCLLQ